MLVTILTVLEDVRFYLYYRDTLGIEDWLWDWVILPASIVLSFAALTWFLAAKLLEIRNWARITVIAYYAIVALLSFIGLVTLKEPIVLLPLGIAGAILIYLNLRHVREAFANRSRSTRCSPSLTPSDSRRPDGPFEGQCIQEPVEGGTK